MARIQSKLPQKVQISGCQKNFHFSSGAVTAAQDAAKFGEKSVMNYWKYKETVFN